MKKIISISLALSSIAILTLFLPSACTKAKVPASFGDTSCPDTISFSQQIGPIIDANCVSCHGNGAGTAPTLSNHAEISANADAILNSLQGIPQLMPQGGPALADSLIQQISCWIKQGKMNN
nr:cytochrome c [uncultured Fluviicola sp.]